MPLRPASCEARRSIAWLAAIIERLMASSGVGKVLSVRMSCITATASCDATSPAFCPPMPSHTTITLPLGDSKVAMLSSLTLRTRPVSVLLAIM